MQPQWLGQPIVAIKDKLTCSNHQLTWNVFFYYAMRYYHGCVKFYNAGPRQFHICREMAQVCRRLRVPT